MFDSAYSPFPLCAPARSAMLTGRLASDIGVYDNAAELAATVPTLRARAPRPAAYHTAVAGKMHFVGPDQLHGFEHRLTADIYPATSTGRRIGRARWTGRCPGTTDGERARPGRVRGGDADRLRRGGRFHAVRKLYDIARHRPDQPFLLFASFTNPHDPWEIPERHWERYRRSEIPDPVVPSLPLQQADPHSRRLRAMCRVDEAG